KSRKRAVDPSALFARLTMAMKLNPNLERALEFASYGEDEMSRDLRAKISRGRLDSPAEVFNDFIEEWKGDYPEIERAGHLLREAVNGKTRENRERYLDLAFDIVLEGSRKRMSEFASSIHLPTIIIYSVGILLPLMLVALIPTFSVISGSVGLAPVAAIYCAILPSAVYLLSRGVLARRPQVLLPPQVSPRKLPGKEMLLCLCIFLLPFFITISLNFPPDVGGILSLWGAVVAFAVYLWRSSSGAYERRKMVARMEEELPEVLMGLGGRVSEGRPAEDVLAKISGEVRGSAFEEPLARTSANVRVGGMGLREAFFGAGGSFSTVESSTVRGVMEMLVSFVERSTRAAGEAICNIAGHLAKLGSLRAEIKKMFGELITSMKSVAVFFAPFVVAITARLQEVLFLKSSQNGFFSGASFSPPAFSIILCIYAVILAALLMVYAVELELGDDRVVKRMVLAVSLPMAILMFTVAWAVGGWMLAFLIG
ncbi:MAG: hypothetical protein ACK4GQ_05470, partial [Candidatus Hadarchaeales archaeon]